MGIQGAQIKSSNMRTKRFHHINSGAAQCSAMTRNVCQRHCDGPGGSELPSPSPRQPSEEGQQSLDHGIVPAPSPGITEPSCVRSQLRPASGRVVLSPPQCHRPSNAPGLDAEGSGIWDAPMSKARPVPGSRGRRGVCREQRRQSCWVVVTSPDEGYK